MDKDSSPRKAAPAPSDVLKVQRCVAKTVFDSMLEEYIAEITNATHSWFTLAYHRPGDLVAVDAHEKYFAKMEAAPRSFVERFLALETRTDAVSFCDA